MAGQQPFGVPARAAGIPCHWRLAVKWTVEYMLATTPNFPPPILFLRVSRVNFYCTTSLGGGDILAVNLVAVYPHIAGEFCKSLIVIGRALDNEQQGVTAVFSPLIGGVFGSGNVAVLCTVRHKGIGFIIGAARCVGDRNDC